MALKLNFLMLFLCSTSFYSCNSHRGENLTAIEFEKFMQENHIIDVRTLEELDQGMIEGAVHIDYYDERFISKVDSLVSRESIYQDNSGIYLYCRSGNRSAKALKALKASGFMNIHHLLGGVRAWDLSNGPLLVQ